MLMPRQTKYRKQFRGKRRGKSSVGNTVAFGQMTVDRSSFAAMSDCVRGVFAGGDGSPAQFSEIDYFNIATTGDAVDFGDLPYDNQQCAGCSNGHGGL